MFRVIIQVLRRCTVFCNFSLHHNEPHMSPYQPQLMKETRIILRSDNVIFLLGNNKKCPDDDLLLRSKLVPPLNTRLCRLLLPIYRQELNIHGYQISAVSKNRCCGLCGQWLFTEFLSWKNMRGAYKLCIAFCLWLYVFNPCVIPLQPS